jgi:hypothetical protein
MNRPANTLVAFQVTATDAQGARRFFPLQIPGYTLPFECLVRFGESVPPGSFPSYRIWMTQAAFNAWDTRNNLNNTLNDITLVFGNHRMVAQSPLHGGKELSARRLHPASTPGSPSTCGNGPGAGEAEKMIDAHRVEEFKHAREPPHPPGESGLLVVRPFVLRMPPMLSVPIEPVRWIAGDQPRHAVTVELEEFRMTPNIRAVLCDKDGQVANQPNTATMRVIAQCAPLPVELELHEPMAGDLVGQSFAGCAQGRGPAQSHAALPLGPGFPAGIAAHRHKQREVFQPVGIGVAKVAEAATVFTVSLSKVGKGAAQPFFAKPQRDGKVDASCGKSGRRLQVALREGALAGEGIERNEPRTSGESRRRIVR